VASFCKHISGPREPRKADNFMVRWTTISFSRRTPLHGVG